MGTVRTAFSQLVVQLWAIMLDAIALAMSTGAVSYALCSAAAGVARTAATHLGKAGRAENECVANVIPFRRPSRAVPAPESSELPLRRAA